MATAAQSMPQANQSAKMTPRELIAIPPLNVDEKPNALAVTNVDRSLTPPQAGLAQHETPYDLPVGERILESGASIMLLTYLYESGCSSAP
jgi:hypothetical protein